MTDMIVLHVVSLLLFVANVGIIEQLCKKTSSNVTDSGIGVAFLYL